MTLASFKVPARENSRLLEGFTVYFSPRLKVGFLSSRLDGRAGANFDKHQFANSNGFDLDQHLSHVVYFFTS